MSELSPLPSEVLPAGIRARFVSRFVGCHLLDGAGHWVQQEQAARVSELLLDFLKRHAA